VVEDGLAEEEVAAGGPDEIVEGVMGVLAAEAGVEDLAGVGVIVAVGVLQVDEVRFLGEIDAALGVEGEGEGDEEVLGEGGALVGFAVGIGVLEDDEFVVGLVAGVDVGVDVGVGGGAGDPEAAAAVPAHLDGAGEFGEVLL